MKPAAFRPRENPDTGRLETSVFRIDALAEADIWALARRAVPPEKPSQPHPARADFAAADVYSVPLDLDPNEDPERHADIIGWGNSSQEQTSQAQRLASRSVLARNPARSD